MGFNLTQVAELNWYGANFAGGSYGFNHPYGVAFDGSHIWVVNYTGNSVTELNANDGSLVRTLSGGSYGFISPVGVAFDGSHIWVTNSGFNSVTELNAQDGSWVRTLSGGSYGFNQPWGWRSMAATSGSPTMAATR
jgi:DNA-binding beta-propeller fold protein YncE